MDLSNESSDHNNGSSKKHNSSYNDILLDFERLRVSALKKAAEISSLVKEVTIGPNSPLKKEIKIEQVMNKVFENTNHSFTDNKVLKESQYTIKAKQFETQLNNTSDELFKNLVEKMVFKRADIMRKYFDKQSEDCERRAVELKMKKLSMMKLLKDNDNLSLLEQAKLDEKHSQMVNMKTIENLNKILEEQNKATAQFASITDSQTKICICYNEISNYILTEPQHKTVIDKYISSINDVMNSISSIIDLCKTGSITEKEVKQAEILFSNIENIKEKIIEDINVEKNELSKQEEIKRQQLEEDKVKEKLSQAAEVQLAEEPLIGNKNKLQFYSARNYKHFEKLRDYLESYEAKFKELLSDINFKKFRFNCQKAVNTPVNSISSVSGVHMRDKYDKLCKLLKGERVQVLDTYVSAAEHPQGLYYCTALLAKKIVSQGDLLVSSKPEAAFPLAAITVALWAQFPEFGMLLEAYFHRCCPYLVPMFLPQVEGQTDKEFYLSRGYKYNDEGVVEKQDKFLKSMSGIFRLKCAIWITSTPRFMDRSDPHGLRFAWCWLASFINLRPEPDICATLLHDFFEVCGSIFLKYYRKQFIKIIRLISDDYLRILENLDEGGPKARLEVFLQNVLNTGQIENPNGLLPPNIW